MTASNMGFAENLWAHRGELLPLAKDLEYAIKNWYTLLHSIISEYSGYESQKYTHILSEGTSHWNRQRI